MPQTQKKSNVTSPSKAKVIPISKKETPKPLKPKPLPPVRFEDLDEESQQELQGYLEERAKLKRQEIHIKSRLEGPNGLNEAIYQLQKAIGVKTVLMGLEDGNTLRTVAYDGTNVQLNKELLLENGVSADIIAKSYKRTPYTTASTTLLGPDGKAIGKGEFEDGE